MARVVGVTGRELSVRRRFSPAACLLGVALLATACATTRREVPGPRSASRPVRSLVAQGDRLRRSGREESALGFYACAIERFASGFVRETAFGSPP